MGETHSCKPSKPYGQDKQVILKGRPWRKNSIIALSAICGLMLWVLDALVKSMVFGMGTFWDRLMGAPDEFYLRLLIIIVFVTFGFLITRIVEGHIDFQERLLSGKKLWEEIFDVISDSITVHDEHFRIVRANRAATRMLGEDFQAILGRQCFAMYHGTDCPPAECPSCRTLRDGCPTTSEIYEPYLEKHLEIKALPLFGHNGAHRGLVHVVKDITERVRYEERLHELTLMDELTGLYNRRGFYTLAEKRIRLDSRLKRKTVIVYVDLNDLKVINDTCGHVEGDNALKSAAEILRQTFRETDILARIGGDEFVIYPSEANEEGAINIVRRLQSTIKAYNLTSLNNYNVSLSIGVASYDHEKPCFNLLDELLSEADKNMYEHKSELKKRRC